MRQTARRGYHYDPISLVVKGFETSLKLAHFFF